MRFILDVAPVSASSNPRHHLGSNARALTPADLERFEAKYHVEPNTGCWLWIGATCSRGYGNFFLRRRTCGACKVAYEHLHGPVPAGFDLDHLCRQRCCVNPDHLEVVTHKENCLRGDSPCARNAVKDVCKNGHTLDERNTYRTAAGRHCRVCRKLAQRNLRARRVS